MAPKMAKIAWGRCWGRWGQAGVKKIRNLCVELSPRILKIGPERHSGARYHMSGAEVKRWGENAPVNEFLPGKYY